MLPIVSGLNDVQIRSKTRPLCRFLVAEAVNAACSPNYLEERSTDSRSSLPALKWGAHFSGTGTLSPVFGLRPILGGLYVREKVPNPRTSTRPPLIKASAIESKITDTAAWQSLCTNCGKRCESWSINSDRVIQGFWHQRVGPGFCQKAGDFHGAGVNLSTAILRFDIKTPFLRALERHPRPSIPAK